MTKALTKTFPSVRSVLPFSYLTMILARFLPSSEFVWAVANTKVPFAALTALQTEKLQKLLGCDGGLLK